MRVLPEDVRIPVRSAAPDDAAHRRPWRAGDPRPAGRLVGPGDERGQLQPARAEERHGLPPERRAGTTPARCSSTSGTCGSSVARSIGPGAAGDRGEAGGRAGRRGAAVEAVGVGQERGDGAADERPRCARSDGIFSGPEATKADRVRTDSGSGSSPARRAAVSGDGGGTAGTPRGHRPTNDAPSTAAGHGTRPRRCPRAPSGSGAATWPGARSVRIERLLATGKFAVVYAEVPDPTPRRVLREPERRPEALQGHPGGGAAGGRRRMTLRQLHRAVSPAMTPWTDSNPRRGIDDGRRNRDAAAPRVTARRPPRGAACPSPARPSPLPIVTHDLTKRYGTLVALDTSTWSSRPATSSASSAPTAPARAPR